MGTCRLTPGTNGTGKLAFFNPITHSSAIMRRSALDAVGEYDRTRRTHVDYDLWMRLAAAGWRVGSVDPQLVARRLHAGQKFERRGHVAYLFASGVIQAHAIRALHGGLWAWVSLGGRIGWGMLPRVVRMGVRRLISSPGMSW